MNVDERVYNICTWFGVIKPRSIVTLVLTAILLNGIGLYTIVCVVGGAMSYLANPGVSFGVLTQINWAAVFSITWWASQFKMILAIMIMGMILYLVYSILDLAFFLIGYALSNVDMLKINVVSNKQTNEDVNMKKQIDGTIETKPALTESDDTPVLTEVVTDDTKPIDKPEDKKPL